MKKQAKDLTPLEALGFISQMIPKIVADGYTHENLQICLSKVHEAIKEPEVENEKSK